MINKQGLWFLTLFSLILVLSIYYITMPNEIFTINEPVNEENNNSNTKDVSSEITTSNYITSLKVELTTKREDEIAGLEDTINDISSTSEEKDSAYLRIKDINNIMGLEEQAEKKLSEEYFLDSYVEISENNVYVVATSPNHDKTLAGNIMKTIQALFTNGVIVSVKFV